MALASPRKSAIALLILAYGFMTLLHKPMQYVAGGARTIPGRPDDGMSSAIKWGSSTANNAIKALTYQFPWEKSPDWRPGQKREGQYVPEAWTPGSPRKTDQHQHQREQRQRYHEEKTDEPSWIPRFSANPVGKSDSFAQRGEQSPDQSSMPAWMPNFFGNSAPSTNKIADESNMLSWWPKFMANSFGKSEVTRPSREGNAEQSNMLATLSKFASNPFGKSDPPRRNPEPNLEQGNMLSWMSSVWDGGRTKQIPEDRAEMPFMDTFKTPTKAGKKADNDVDIVAVAGVGAGVSILGIALVDPTLLGIMLAFAGALAFSKLQSSSESGSGPVGII